ncbi:MAG: hypothetical protein KJ067_25275 [Vicinamibacteria bacterium]|nr:hypothetical protein [Vicinamibacteria bacterium]
MNLADWLGLVHVEPLRDVAAHRWALALLALAWVLAAARGHRRLALALGCAWGVAGPLFWALALERPLGYGLDPQATRAAAELVVAAASGRAGESALAGEPVAATVVARFAAGGRDADTWLALAALAPALVTPLLALAAFVTGRGERAALLAALLLTSATGDLDALRGTGLASGIAYRPQAALVLPVVLAFALLAGRVPRSGAVLAGLLAAGGLALPPLGLPAPAPPSPPGLESLPWALTLDHAPWLALATLRWLQWRAGAPLAAEDRAATGLAAAGLGLGLLGAAGLGPLAGDPWAGHVAWRLSLLLLASGAALPLLHALAAALKRWRPLAAREDAHLAAAALVVITAPGAFTAWWAADRLDPLARDSGEPLSANALTAAAWLDAHAPGDAVVLCSPTYLPEVLLAGRRRVLRGPGLGQPADAPRRERAEKAALQGREAGPLYARYGLRYLFVGPGDFRAHGVSWPDALVGRPGLVLRHVAPGGFHLYELVAGGNAAGG